MAINNVNAANFAVLRSGTSGTTGTMDFSGSVVKGAGLDLITPTSIANSGGSASASGGGVTFTGVSSISLNGVFTSTYLGYICTISVTGSAAADMKLRLRAGGSDDAGGNYDNGVARIVNNGNFTSWATNSATNIVDIGQIDNSATLAAWGRLDIAGPQTVGKTRIISDWTGAVTGAGSAARSFGATVNNATTQFDGVTIYPSTGTITGTIRVYGYHN